MFLSAVIGFFVEYTAFAGANNANDVNNKYADLDLYVDLYKELVDCVKVDDGNYSFKNSQSCEFDQDVFSDYLHTLADYHSDYLSDYQTYTYNHNLTYSSLSHSDIAKVLVPGYSLSVFLQWTQAGMFVSLIPVSIALVILLAMYITQSDA